MNIQPNASASVAGVSRAAARGGEADNQASESVRQQTRREAPAGKTGETTVDAGDQTEDRDADGRQVLDTFERSGKRSHDDSSQEEEQRQDAQIEPLDDGDQKHELDFEA